MQESTALETDFLKESALHTDLYRQVGSCCQVTAKHFFFFCGKTFLIPPPIKSLTIKIRPSREQISHFIT